MSTDPAAAKIRTAASVGIATSPTTPEKATMISSIQIPDQIEAQRVRAPAARVERGLPDRAADRLPLEQAAGDVADALGDEVAVDAGRRAAGVGATSRTPAPCTSTITAIASAPTTRSNENWSSAGSAGSGRPLGMSPMSSTRCTTSFPVTTSTAVGTTSARSALNPPSVVRDAISNSASAPIPVRADAHSTAAGSVTTLNAFATAVSPCAGTPSNCGSWPRTMLAATPVRNPVITECDTKRV